MREFLDGLFLDSIVILVVLYPSHSLRDDRMKNNTFGQIFCGCVLKVF